MARIHKHIVFALKYNTPIRCRQYNICIHDNRSNNIANAIQNHTYYIWIQNIGKAKITSIEGILKCQNVK